MISMQLVSAMFSLSVAWNAQVRSQPLVRTVSHGMGTLRIRFPFWIEKGEEKADGRLQIGTYNAAVLAARHGIPFIVVAPVSTVDMDIEDGSR